MRRGDWRRAPDRAGFPSSARSSHNRAVEYRLDPVFRGFCVFWAVVCAALVVTAPLAVFLLRIARHAGVTMRQDGLQVRWIRTREVAWHDVMTLRRVPTRSAVRESMGPVQCLLRDGARPLTIAAAAHERHRELLAELERRTGLRVEDPEASAPVRIPTMVGVLVLLLVVALVWLAAAR